ncbi:MAG: xanthan lyase [Isosphaera sp.]|nr:xanthan lyase [Isosphaera sp.]
MVYGATPGGIAAALAAADDGEAVLLVEPTARVGGLVTNGLSHTDFRTFEGLSGTFLDLTRRVEAHYVTTYGKDSPQARACFRGTFGEPHVNLAVLRAMLAERKGVRVKTGSRLDAVEVRKDRVEAATFVGPDGGRWAAKAAVFVDGTYEGDLMAKAGVPWKVGREGKAEYGEGLAPEKADDQLQAYNFRFTMTRDPKNRVAPTAPPGYRRDDFLPVVKVLESGMIAAVFGNPSGCIFKAQRPALPNGKYDINDVSNGLVRLSLPGANRGWPDGDPAARAKVFAEHLRDQAGLLYFLQTDEAVPEKFRKEAAEWGWCKDEFADTGHLPGQLYVREARRMVGAYVFTEKDSGHAAGDARAVLRADAVAAGDYGNNCHGTAHEGDRFGGRHTGEFYKPVPPYQVPYGVIVPRAVDNLLVPVAVSSSHVGFCALRLEPIWASLGQAAGHAAHLARKEKVAVQKVPVGRLQARLHTAGSATIYVSDVRPGDADFAAVQWWGTAGGLHGLAPTPEKPGQRGKQIVGQYFEAFPGHAAELGRVLDPGLADQWRKLAGALGLPADKLPAADGTRTRGDWVRAAAALRK